ncbi:MAG: exodeoxyribonuclease VII large subunit [Verrucomicrobiota bacterium]|nr:exodeoxyribonuclease VII large subunit [Verrucomicrobiota bacterium]
MDDLFEYSAKQFPSEEKNEERSIYSVSELTRKIRNLLEYKIGEIWVEGEISNLRKQASGHQYFTLKDAKSQLSCVLFRGNASKMALDLNDGQEIEVRGDLSVYEPRGNYQLIVRNAQLKGHGSLQLQFEALKKKLNAEGLFKEETKSSIPSFPDTICIVTSPTGAAVRDMISVIQRRAPWVKILVYPVLVQGNQASSQIVEALANIDQWTKKAEISIDTVVLTRGGGSLEDLWPFNEEDTARAIHKLSLPIISAIGHEIDYTISDFVADLRAPTPSAAAEILVPEKDGIRRNLNNLNHSLNSKTISTIDRWHERLEYLGTRTLVNEPIRILAELEQSTDWKLETLQKRFFEALGKKEKNITNYDQRLTLSHPAKQLEEVFGKLKILNQSLDHSLSKKFNQLKERYQRGAISLKNLGPQSVLERGFSLTHDKDGNLVTSSKEIRSGDKITTNLKDGSFESTID